MSNDAAWQAIENFTERFEANVAALQGRDTELAKRLRELRGATRRQYGVHGASGNLGVMTGERFEALPIAVDSAAAKRIAGELTPAGKYQIPLLIAGLDQGWLEDLLYKTPCGHPALPGHRPPLYLVAGDLERLWAVLHLHDWRAMLGDPRVLFFVGADAICQVDRFLRCSKSTPWPQMAVTVDKSVWAGGFANLDSLLRPVQQLFEQRVQRAQAELGATYDGRGIEEIHGQFSTGKKLRILGITSRFTTFLRYSMRDWLSGMRRLGHETRLVIEEADHELFGPLQYAEACASFKPDLVLMIDHYRAEMRLLPGSMPCVMWLQDDLPNVYRVEAGRNQGRLDYTIGFGNRDCTRKFEYPASRFLPTMMAVNEMRFAPRRLTPGERERFGCDVCFVSHCSTPADVVIREAMQQKKNDHERRLIKDVYERLEAVYDRGDVLVQPYHLRELVGTAARSLSLEVADEGPIVSFFHQRIVNPLFRHQSLKWLAELDVKIHLYGKGWESHPRLGRFAKGPADNQSVLSTIYRASAINLQVTPYGAAHQRVFEGLACGGFFLLRYCEGDPCHRWYRELWEFCREHEIKTDEEFLKRAPREVLEKYRRTAEIEGVDAIEKGWDFVGLLNLMAAGQFTQCASTLWPGEYEKVVFNSREELHGLVTHFLGNPEEREEIANRMRGRVLDLLTYTSTSRRLLEFIASDLGGDRGVSAVKLGRELLCT